MDKVALIVIFNHKYTKNLEILDEIYQSRFSDVWYVMPFYEGEREDVIPVYESSYYFHGYIATAISFLKNKGYDYYFTTGDDVFLNPIINEKNFKDFFKVDEDTAFIPGPFLLNNPKETRPSRPYFPVWNGLNKALNFKINQPGIHTSSILPSNEEAIRLLKSHGFNFTERVPRNMFFSNPVLKLTEGLKSNYHRLRIVFDNLRNIIYPKKLPYPLIGSYSDVVIISNKHQNKFTKYCGAFSALNLFVEIALPTSIAFAYPKIISEDNLNYKGETYWYYNHHECEKKYKNSLSFLKNNFPDKVLYIHPIKLSKWK